MAWTWCSGIAAWGAHVGATPAGYVYPTDNSNDPDLSGVVPLNGEISFFSAPAAFDYCTVDFGVDPRVAYADYGAGPRWTDVESPVGGTAPGGTNLYVLVSGPNYDETDPEPSWDASDALGWLRPIPASEVTSAWSVKAVDACTGSNPATLAGVAIHPIRQPLNVPDTVDLEIRTTDPALAEFRDPAREIQVWQDDTIRFWGPGVRIEIDDHRARIQCADPSWYLTRRFFGQADRPNGLVNGEFEDGLTGWTAVGLTPVVDPTRAVQGTRSVRLTGTAEGHDTYLTQTYTHVQAHPDGDQLTIAAHVWVSADEYQGDALESLGLVAFRTLAAGGDPVDVQSGVSPQGPAIEASTPKDQWVRLETTLDFVKDGDTVEVRLYPPWGAANYDLVTLTGRESLSFIEQDMATIIRGVVQYAQGAYFDHGKSDLNLAVAADPTGVTLSRTYEFADHQNIADELMVFTRRRGGVDYHVAVTATTRTLVVSHPHRGTVRDDLTLTWGGNVTRFRLSEDRTQKGDTSVVLGPGDGPDREEGGATATPNGPTLEDVTVAPDGTEVGELDRAADERLAVITHPEVLEVTCTGLIGNLQTGDWVPVTISVLSMSEVVYRVVAVVLDPANDSLVATLNLRDPITPEEAMARFPRAVDACLAPGGGVWVVGSDGGVGAYGVADFHGSLPGEDIIPNAPVVAIVPHGADGYWVVCADTGLFAFGDAPGRGGYPAMIDTEYALGDRAIVAAEPFDPAGEDNVVMIADDGSLYYGDLTP